MIGKEISHYRILERLGGGGMGVVYKAEDTKLKRTVALKFLPADLTRDEDAKERFVHEAQAASALDHNNICNIHEIDETASGQMFIAMAYYEGETLKKKIERGPLRLDEAVNIALQIAEGLARAHEEDIVHRDIKPANVMITNRGEVKTVDFGLAKLSGRTKLTKEGTTLGTVAYMSPEQAQGAEVDPRTDIWALGTVLYEMVTGQQPFHGDYEQAVIYSIMNEDAEPLTGLRTGVPMELERLVNKCIAKEPTERYQHVDELLVDLRQVKKELESRETVPRPSVGTRIQKKATRPFVLPSILLGVLILAFSGYFLFFRPEEVIAERIPLAVVDFVNETDENELNGLSGLLITALEQSRRLSVLTRSRMFDVLKQLGKEDVEYIDETLGIEICKRAKVEALVIASIRKLGRRYVVDLKVLDPQKDQYLFTAKEEGEGQESIFAMIDRLAKNTQLGLKEKAEEIQAAKQYPTTKSLRNLAKAAWASSSPREIKHR